MKCPKCGYISFDHNHVCPKCNKDIAAEQAKMNVLTFAPKTPFLLGALTGESNESSVGLHIDSGSGVMAAPRADIEMEAPEALGEQEAGLGDSQELDISLEPDALGEAEEPAETFSLEEAATEAGPSLEEGLEDFEFEMPSEDDAEAENKVEVGGIADEPSVIADDKDLTFDLGDLGVQAEEPRAPAGEESVVDTDDLALDLEDLSLEEAAPATEAAPPPEPEAATPEAPEEIPPAEPPADAEEDLGLDLEDLALDDSGAFGDDETRELPGDDVGFDLEDIASGASAGAEAEQPAEEEEAIGVDIDSLILDEDLPAKEEASPAGEEDEDEVVLNLEDLKVNATGELEIGTDIPAVDTGADEVPLDLDDFSLDDSPAEKAKSGEEAVQIGESTIDLGDEELDLEGLDLDLDLDEPEKK